MCCFCAGKRKASEEDHIPGRSIFNDREWPEGFVFPSCSECNRGTRGDEQIVALLCRMNDPSDWTNKNSDEFTKNAEGIERNQPDVFREMTLTDEQIGDAVSRYPSVDPGKLVNLSGPLITTAIQRFGFKLGCALYYKHSGQTLPAEGGVAVTWFSNLQMMNAGISSVVAEILSREGVVKRNSRPLAGQFTYDYDSPDGWEFAAFQAKFRESFSIVCVANVDVAHLETLFDTLDKVTIWRPGNELAGI